MLLRLTLLIAALAAEPTPPPSLQGFADAHPACREWSDGCAVCKRDEAVHCSTPGIACQPAEITCKAP